MSKAVLISIRPEWCDKIIKGQKTIEVRKTRPKIDTPFKCYIYECKRKLPLTYSQVIYPVLSVVGTGKVIGEFMCDYIAQFESEFYDDDSVLNAVWSPEIEENVLYKIWGNDDVDLPKFAKQIAMTLDELKSYIGTDKPCKEFYGWHISNLVVYDKPRELREFFVVDKKAVKECSLRERIYTNPDYTHGAFLPGTYVCNKNPVDVDFCNGGCWKKSLTHPPQSWCYVEELK